MWPEMQIVHVEVGQRNVALDHLVGSVWHTTSPARFTSIVSCAKILREPKIPDGERWTRSIGGPSVPFVRHLGGISLFDLRNFDLPDYERKCPSSSWDYFIPYPVKHGSAIWIEIDFAALGADFIDGASVIKLWEDREAYKHNVMPWIEAASLSDVPTALFKRVVKFYSENFK